MTETDIKNVIKVLEKTKKGIEKYAEELSSDYLRGVARGYEDAIEAMKFELAIRGYTQET